MTRIKQKTFLLLCRGWASAFRNQGSELLHIIPRCVFFHSGLGLGILKPGFGTFANCSILFKFDLPFVVIWLGFVVLIFGRLGFDVVKPGFGVPGYLGFRVRDFCGYVLTVLSF